ncbi:MAG: GNAT family N-acetyltransferase [Rubrivivax sp.]|nr:GNAT family N-acetyltransferase [Rubrivivax sp.]
MPMLPGYTLAPIAWADLHDWAAFALRPEMQRFTSTQFTSVDDLRPMIERCLGGSPDAPCLFSVRAAHSGELVSVAGFHSVSSLNRTAEITYSVRPECWGHGLATAVCGALVHWGLQQRGWVRIQATTQLPAQASQRVLQKCGFEREGVLRHFRLVRGLPQDYVVFSRLPDANPDA